VKTYLLKILLIPMLLVIGYVSMSAEASHAVHDLGNGTWLLSWHFTDENGMTWKYNELRSQTGTLLNWSAGQYDPDDNIIWRSHGGDGPFWWKESYTEIEEADKTQLFYHNGILHVRGEISNPTLSLFEISGQLIYKDIMKNRDGLNLHHIPQGFYIVMVESASQVSSFKIRIGE